jgi:hypothetical protein
MAKQATALNEIVIQYTVQGAEISGLLVADLCGRKVLSASPVRDYYVLSNTPG